MANLEDGKELTRRAWQLLRSRSRELGLPDLFIESLGEFNLAIPRQAVSIEEQNERKSILDQAEILFRTHYAHLAFKKKRGLANPFLSIEKIRKRLIKAPFLPFHRQMANLFVSQDDAHTLYGLPHPFRNSIAFLPFQIKDYKDAKGVKRYIIWKIMPGFEHPDFKTGVELVSWQYFHQSPTPRPVLEPIERAVQLHADEEVGGNPAARLANGLKGMCLRSLSFKPSPKLTTQVFEFRSARDGKIKSMVVPWAVGRGLSSADVFAGGGRSCSDEMMQLMRGGMALMSTDKRAQELSPKIDRRWDSRLKEIFEFQITGGKSRRGYLNPDYMTSAAFPEKKFGYIRIKSFDLPSDDQDVLTGVPRVIEEFKRLLVLQMKKAPDGLILDLRGNPGGQVNAAESMLQMLTPKRIHPAKFHLPWNEGTEGILRKLKALGAKKKRNKKEQESFEILNREFGAWVQDLDAADKGGKLPKLLSSGQQVTSDEQANDIGQIYQGPVVLIINAFTYSAADIFSGGFQDHQIGLVLGLDQATGGGGAVRQTHEEMLMFANQAAIPLQKLPGGVTMRMAVLRSTRVLKRNGEPIEDVGVLADEIHDRSREDILEGNPKLIAKACALLAERKAYQLEILSDRDVHEGDLEGIEVRIQGHGFEKLKAEIDGVSMPVKPGKKEGRIRIFGDIARSFEPVLILTGLDAAGKPVVSTRKRLEDK